MEHDSLTGWWSGGSAGSVGACPATDHRTAKNHSPQYEAHSGQPLLVPGRFGTRATAAGLASGATTEASLLWSTPN